MVKKTGKKYCGPSWFPDYFRSEYHNNSCYNHDMNYTLSYFSRKESDKIFLKEMLAKSKKDKSLKRIIQSYVYYYFVRIFGWIYYGKP